MPDWDKGAGRGVELDGRRLSDAASAHPRGAHPPARRRPPVRGIIVAAAGPQ